MMGFGIFEAFFGASPNLFTAGTPIVRFFKFFFVGHAVYAYLAILFGVLRLLPRDTLEGQDLKRPFFHLILLFMMALSLFAVNLTERVGSLSSERAIPPRDTGEVAPVVLPQYFDVIFPVYD